MNITLLLAGGTGTRLGLDMPKQYIEVNKKPIIAYSLEIFEKHVEIGAIQIVADLEWRDFILKWTGSKFRGFSKPGKNRQLSVLNALTDISKYADVKDVVIIHDAVRPFVSDKLISDCLHSCGSHDGALPVLPMKDTVYMGNGNRITSLLDRQSVYAGQAPEAFVFGKYLEANQTLLPDQILGINGSTEPAVLAGMDIALVHGEEANFKITTREDLKRCQRILEERKN